MIDYPIEQRNTGKGVPGLVYRFNKPLTNRQQKLLDALQNNGDYTVLDSPVSMIDLSALTAKTGVEFALFSKGIESLVVRGYADFVDIDVNEAKRLANDGWRWSGHTHPGDDRWCLSPSAGDEAVLACFEQTQSVIYNSVGQFETFKGRSHQ